MNRNDRQQRATDLVDILCRFCNDASYKSLRETLFEVGQNNVVETYLAENPWSSGISIILCIC